MSNTFFIADTHWDHAGILNIPGRAGVFSSLDDMNERLIENWNKTVTMRDVVYHLGDVLWKDARAVEILPRLNGFMKYLVAGNHDTPKINVYFDKVFGAKVFDGCILTHIPIHPTELHPYWTANIHGHLHNARVPGDDSYICVSVEQTSFYPRPWDDIKQQVKLIEAEMTYSLEPRRRAL